MENDRSAHTLAQDHLVDMASTALHGTDKEAKKSAIATLASVGSDRATRILISALRGDTSNASEAAMPAIWGITNRAAVPPLIEALKDDNTLVRWVVAETLGKLGDKQAIPPLLNALDDPRTDGPTKKTIRWALDILGCQESLVPQEETDYRWHVSHELKQTWSGWTADLLCFALTDDRAARLNYPVLKSAAARSGTNAFILRGRFRGTNSTDPVVGVLCPNRESAAHALWFGIAANAFKSRKDLRMLLLSDQGLQHFGSSDSPLTVYEYEYVRTHRR